MQQQSKAQLAQTSAGENVDYKSANILLIATDAHFVVMSKVY